MAPWREGSSAPFRSRLAKASASRAAQANPYEQDNPALITDEILAPMTHTLRRSRS
jgi:hypothetical protein